MFFGRLFNWSTDCFTACSRTLIKILRYTSQSICAKYVCFVILRRAILRHLFIIHTKNSQAALIAAFFIITLCFWAFSFIQHVKWDVMKPPLLDY